MTEYLIIGDIAGQLSALLRLVKRVPDNCRIISVGDMVDRGPHSSSVLYWFMKNHSRAEALFGNHEHLMLDACQGNFHYAHGVWEMNGGIATLDSYEHSVRRSDLSWLARLPYYKFIEPQGDEPRLLITHAPLPAHLTLEETLREGYDMLWNRGLPGRKDYFQVFGHNSHWGLRYFEDYALCIDTSRDQVLTGLHWPSREIIQEPYGEEPKPVEIHKATDQGG